MNSYSIQDILSFIEDNYRFLHIGSFLSWYIKNNNISDKAKNINIILGQHRGYVLNGYLIKQMLEDIYVNSNKGNIFGYFVEWNAIRGIAMAVKEGIKTNEDFKNFLKIKLNEQYKYFDIIISFIRNILSHNIDNEIRILDNAIYNGTKRHVLNHIADEGIIKFSFKYNQYLPEISSELPMNYGFAIKINFNGIRIGQKFLQIIPLWELYMLSELCYNLSILFHNEND